MATFNELAKNEKNQHWAHIFQTIAARENDSQLTQDGQEPIVLDGAELQQIQSEMYAEVKDNLTRDGSPVQSVAEMKQALRLQTENRITGQIQQRLAERKLRQDLAKNPGIVQDGYMNPVSGIGTAIDPGMYTEAFVPVSITPEEATAYYSNGGLPSKIIDKKAGCLTLNGVHFECDAFSPEDLAALEAYAEKCGFNRAYDQTNTLALTFGGAFCYPVMKGDGPQLYDKSVREILKAIPEEKNFIKYWVTADRWNCVFTPDYNITAQDYLHARHIFVPLGGIRLNTQRCAMVKPTALPFWGAIKQMGWSCSDFEGWIKDFESYQIMKMSLPIMAQQMSLMYHQFPADGLIIENGPEYAKQFMKENEKEMRSWSMLNPKAVNSVGEIKILERTYTGFQQLIQESRLALSASSKIPSSTLFPEKATGLASDNEDDVTLKQSETIRLLFKNVAPAYKNVIALLVMSCFGKNSDQAKHAWEVTLAPDTGVVLSDQDKAQLGSSFTQIIGGLVAVGAPLSTAVNVAKKFIPSADLDEKTMNELTGDEAEGMDQDLWNTLNAAQEMPGPQFGGV